MVLIAVSTSKRNDKMIEKSKKFNVQCLVTSEPQIPPLILLPSYCMHMCA